MKPKKTLSAQVLWADGSVVSPRAVLILDSKTTGRMRDGRPVKLVDGNWIYDVPQCACGADKEHPLHSFCKICNPEVKE